MENKRIRDAVNKAKVIWTAECVGVSTNYVEKVIRGDRCNERVLGTFMEIQERIPTLLEAVKKIAPKF